MSGIFGHLNVNDRDRVFSATVGQSVIYDTATEWVADRNEELNLAMAVLVERVTDEFKNRYKLPGAGYLQERDPDGRYRAVKAVGQWDTAYPIRDYGAQIAGNDVDMAYMTIGDLNRHLLTVVSQNVATVRFLTLQAVLNNAPAAFNDPDHGSLTLVPLANGDAVLYPPLGGTDTEATENHYLASGYTAANISNTNNPILTIRDELLEHWGEVATGTNIAVFIHPDQEAKVSAITGYVAVSDRFIQEGDDTATISGLPSSHPGVLIGRLNGCWIIKWRFIPTNYMVGVDLDRPAPVIKRVDPADTGLARDLNLVSVDEEFPFRNSFWRHRMGFAVGNRLNGVVMFLTSGSTYTIPTGYS